MLLRDKFNDLNCKIDIEFLIEQFDWLMIYLILIQTLAKKIALKAD